MTKLEPTRTSSDLTATERLRVLLDERGVAWEDASPVPSMHPWKTSYISFTGEEVTISCYDEPKWLMGTMVFLTPEQAIAATLGSCNCSNSERTTTVDETDRISISWQDGRHVTIHVMECSECGHTYEHVNGDYEYCPHCGRRCVG